MQETTSDNQEKKRSELLTVLCLFSFIGSGLAAFSNLMFFVSFDLIGQLLPEIEGRLTDFGFKGDEFQLLLSGGKNYFFAGFVLYMISLMGVTRMWNLRKIGFHLYSAAQIFILILPAVSLKGHPFSIINTLLTGVFIFAYSTQLRSMT